MLSLHAPKQNLNAFTLKENRENPTNNNEKIDQLKCKIKEIDQQQKACQELLRFHLTCKRKSGDECAIATTYAAHAHASNLIPNNKGERKRLCGELAQCYVTECYAAECADDNHHKVMIKDLVILLLTRLSNDLDQYEDYYIGSSWKDKESIVFDPEKFKNDEQRKQHAQLCFDLALEHYNQITEEEIDNAFDIAWFGQDHILSHTLAFDMAFALRLGDMASKCNHMDASNWLAHFFAKQSARHNNQSLSFNVLSNADADTTNEFAGTFLPIASHR